MSFVALSRSARAASRCAPCSAFTALTVTMSMPASGHMQLAMVSPFDGRSGIVTLFSRDWLGRAPSAVEISLAVRSVQARTWLGAAWAAAAEIRRAALKAVRCLIMELLLREL